MFRSFFSLPHVKGTILLSIAQATQTLSRNHLCIYDKHELVPRTPKYESRNKKHRCWRAHSICANEKKIISIKKMRLPGARYIFQLFLRITGVASYIGAAKHNPGWRKFGEIKKKNLYI